MTVTPFRFVHATCLSLDEPLAGLGMGLQGEERHLAEDATLIAWERILDLAIDAQAELLLLTGNTFLSTSGSLRARVALERGFRRLDDAGIRVCIVPGPGDPAAVWERDVQLPPNVDLLEDESAETVLIERNGQALASVRVIASARSDEAGWSAQGPAAFDAVRAPWHIGLVPAGTPIEWQHQQPVALDRPDVSRAAATLVKTAMEAGCNYLALGEGVRSTYAYRGGIAHDPGPVQSLGQYLTGPCGVSIVDVLPTGEARIAPSTVAPVRWETMGVDINADTSFDELAERMALTLLEREPDSDDEMWIVLWKLRGQGAALHDLSEPRRLRELWKRIEAETEGAPSLRRVHQLVREPRWEQLQTASEETLGRAFLDVVEAEGTALIDTVRQELLSQEWNSPAHRRLLIHLMEETPSAEVLVEARAAGLMWLA